MKQLKFFLLLLLISSCQRTWEGEGPVVRKERSTGKFNRVVLNMNCTVLIKDSMNHSCIVNAQENLQEAIITRLDGNTLVITSKGTIEKSEPVLIEISMNQIEGFELNGSGKIKGMNTFKNDVMDIEVSGSGTLEADIVTDKLSAAISGSGILNLSGSSNDFDVEIGGSGTVNAYDFSSFNARAKISGSGEAYLNPGESLKADVNGSGSIFYKGDPKVSKEISGSGTVEKAR